MGVLNDRIKERRLERGLTLLDLADSLGIREATMQRYESGEIKNIKHETIVSLAKILNCSPCYLMGWEDTVPEDVVLTLSNDEKNFILTYRKLNNEGKRKLSERADELLDLGYVQKGEEQKMA